MQFRLDPLLRTALARTKYLRQLHIEQVTTETAIFSRNLFLLALCKLPCTGRYTCIPNRCNPIYFEVLFFIGFRSCEKRFRSFCSQRLSRFVVFNKANYLWSSHLLLTHRRFLYTAVEMHKMLRLAPGLDLIWQPEFQSSSLHPGGSPSTLTRFINHSSAERPTLPVNHTASTYGFINITAQTADIHSLSRRIQTFCSVY